MKNIPTFDQFLVSEGVQIPILDFLVNLVMAALLAYLLGRAYVRYGKAHSNRGMMARNFVIIAATTTLIIAIVKSSLALSLGLVGALSIVRFRAAIKEPEELAFLFLTIGIGLGFGADQRVVTVVAVLAIIAIIILRNRVDTSGPAPNLYVTVECRGDKRATTAQIVEALAGHTEEVSLKRLDESKDSLEATFVVGFRDYAQLEKGKSALQRLDESMKVSFLDNEGLF
ncbi:MAG: DUF4956 domain-containing protein [Chloroflexi bacterium]|nr:DUF4956 domain-containing protein [Chloroflexota bacterium]